MIPTLRFPLPSVLPHFKIRLKEFDVTITAIETFYAGHRFRSRLEARWAVFFDHLGIFWEYEPQGYKLPSGPYLPDFWLPAVNAQGSDGVWIEIKPATDSDLDDRWFEFASGIKKSLIVARGIGREGEQPEMEEVDQHGWDNDRLFVICHCRRVGVTYSGYLDRLHCGCATERKSAPDPSDDARIQAAFIAARSARFEYGERG